MEMLPLISLAASVGGTILQIAGAHQQANAAKTAANFEATQLEQNANSAMAAAEVKEEQQVKETGYVLSNAQAAAAASGGGATDPTVNTTMKTIAGEGRFRALTDMYQGEEQAQNLRTQAAATRYGGAAAAAADESKMYSTILGGASSLYDKYASVNSWQQAPAPLVRMYQQ